MSHATTGDGLTINIYGYTPFEGAGIAFIVLFSILTIANIGLAIRSRIWWTIVVAVGGVCELIGWVGRLWSALNVTSLDGFLMQEICLILAPCFFSCMVYGCLGMLIRALGPEYSRLRPNWYLWVFCTADLIAIIIQAIGGAMAALALEDHKESKTGTHVMVAGIVFQLFSMVVFCYLGAEFFVRARAHPSHVSNLNVEGGRVNLFVFGLAFSTMWILIRCVYRTVELAEGWTGYLITHQRYFLALDAVPMVLAMGIFVFTHPYYCLPEFRTLSTTPDVQPPDEEKASRRWWRRERSGKD